jgi:hypothetical protein
MLASVCISLLTCDLDLPFGIYLTRQLDIFPSLKMYIFRKVK